MNLRPSPITLACLAGLASLSGCGSDRPTRTGSPIRDPNNPLQIKPGAPAMAADGEVFTSPGRSTPPRPVAATPTPKPPAPQPAATPTPKPIATTPGREPEIDLGDETATRPITPTPTPAPAATPKPAPTRPPARDPAIDLDEPRPTTPNTPTTPAKPTPNPGSSPAKPAPAAPTPVEVPAPAARVDAGTLAAATDRAVELIQALSRSEQPEVRGNAAEAAGLVPRKLESVITTALSDRNEGVQSIAAMTIGRNRLVGLAPRVKPLLSSPSPYVETAAVMALARNNEPVEDAKISRLGELLFTSTSPRIRAHVAYVIGEIGNPSALPMLKDAAAMKMPLAAQGEINSMQLQLAEAMVKLGDLDQIEVIRASLQPARPDDLEATAVAVQILGELGDKRPIDQLVYLSAYREPNTKAPFPAEVRMQVASSLAKLGLDKGGFIADEFWKSENPALRAQSAGVYGDTGRAEHLEKLVLLMEDPVEQVRITAAAAVLKVARKAGTLPK